MPEVTQTEGASKLTINWVALLQAITALIGAFTGGTPTPPPAKP